MRSLAVALSLALLVAGCASTPSVTGTVPLGPNGRVQGLLRIPANSETTLRLQNLGPGRADFVVREDGGGVLMEGSLGEAQSISESTEPRILIVVAEAYSDAATTVSWQVLSESGLSVEWDLEGQFRGGEPAR